ARTATIERFLNAVIISVRVCHLSTALILSSCRLSRTIVAYLHASQPPSTPGAAVAGGLVVPLQRRQVRYTSTYSSASPLLKSPLSGGCQLVENRDHQDQLKASKKLGGRVMKRHAPVCDRPLPRCSGR